MFCLQCGDKLEASVVSAGASISSSEDTGQRPAAELVAEDSDGALALSAGLDPIEASSDGLRAEAHPAPGSFEASGGASAEQDDTHAGPSGSTTLALRVRRDEASGEFVSADSVDASSSATVDQRLVATHSKGAGQQRGQIVLLQEDGTDGQCFPLTDAATRIGRSEGEVCFPEDEFLAATHLMLLFDGPRLTVESLPTTNGVYRRISEPTVLNSGAGFRIGQELLVFELLTEVLQTSECPDTGTVSLGSGIGLDCWGRLSQVMGPSAMGQVFLLRGDTVTIGREQGDVVFPFDGYVSGSHARITRDGERYSLEDLGSSNGTYIRLMGTYELKPMDLLLAGQQLFRVEFDG